MKLAMLAGSLVLALLAAEALGLHLLSPETAPAVSVHAERAGLSLQTCALSGRVALVASRPILRWRIVGVTGWMKGSGHVLTRRWDTTNVRDGSYRLELLAPRRVTQAISVRNVKPLPGSPFANASAGLDTRSTDAHAVVAVFSRRSYRPGETAVLHLWDRYPSLNIELLHVGPEQTRTVGNETMNGLPVGRPLSIAGGRRAVTVAIGSWESGLYAARLTSGRKVGYAPFIVRPAQLGKRRVAVIEPTDTWQAYNYRDANGDGRADTWYYDASHTAVDLARPYLDRGVPPHFRAYDLAFLHWLARTGKHVDMLAQDDLERLSGERLARLYDLIVFPGHHEYVTTAEYDAVQRYRDLGGHLAFLSANNFFYRVNREGNVITRIGRWRDLGRSEAALIGVQYFNWNLGSYKSRPFTIDGVRRAPWLFKGLGLHDGSKVGWWGIEVDGRAPTSPRSLRVLAVMPNAFGTGRAAQMAYYETSGGARVFAAGAFTLAGSAGTWTISHLLENLWDHLAPPAPADAAT